MTFHVSFLSCVRPLYVHEGLEFPIGLSMTPLDFSRPYDSYRASLGSCDGFRQEMHFNKKLLSLLLGQEIKSCGATRLDAYNMRPLIAYWHTLILITEYLSVAATWVSHALMHCRALMQGLPFALPSGVHSVWAFGLRSHRPQLAHPWLPNLLLSLIGLLFNWKDITP